MKLDQDMISSLRESLENIDKIKNEQGLVVLAAFYTYLLNATKNRLEAVRGGVNGHGLQISKSGTRD